MTSIAQWSSGGLGVEGWSQESIMAISQFISKYGERRLRSHTDYLFNGKHGWRSWVATADDSHIIGFTAYNPDVDTMDSVTVIENICREKGLAEQLLNVKIQDARDLGLHKYVTTIGATNIPSINLVTKMGFSLVKGEMKEYGPILRFEMELNR